MGLIIPVSMLEDVLPDEVTDENGALTNAVTRASAFCNTWAVKYLEFEAYTPYSEAAGGSGSSSSSSGIEDGEDTINAPAEIVHICLEVAKALYWQNQGQIYRDGSEQQTWSSVLDGYKKELKEIEIAPTWHTLSISLDSRGYQLISRSNSYNVLTHTAYIVSGTTNVWNLGRHFQIIRGNIIDANLYFLDAWYLDAATYVNQVEGTLHYQRTYRRDSLDYMRTWRSNFGLRGYSNYSEYPIYPVDLYRP